MDEFETYEDVIDAYNANDMGYSTLTDYIKGQNIKIKEISMEPLADLQKSLFENKADGGMIGIEVLFGPKREKFNMGGGQFTSGGNISPGTDRRGNVRDDNPFTGGGGGGGNTIKVAELTPKQKKFINQQKFGLQENLIPARDIFNKITNPNLNIFDTGTFGFGGQEPTTEEEFNEYLKSIGVVQQVKDGGRVGFFMGGPALEGQALQIYNSMKNYNFSDQEIADALSARGLYTPAGSGSTQPEQVTGIINQQIQTGGRDDDKKTGFGKFGNLDPTTEKTFVKDVYTIDKNAAPGAPMTGSFKPTEVTGYLNVNTGNYQTLEGKNINHAGIPIKPGIVAIAEALGFGPIDETQFTGLPYREGYIAGTFTGQNPLDFFKKQQATLADIQAMNKKAVDDLRAKQAAEEAAKRRATERRIISGGANIQGDGGGDRFTTRSGDTYAAGDYSDVAGTLADPREKMDFYRDGGLATMFTRRR